MGSQPCPRPLWWLQVALAELCASDRPSRFLPLGVLAQKPKLFTLWSLTELASPAVPARPLPCLPAAPAPAAPTRCCSPAVPPPPPGVPFPWSLSLPPSLALIPVPPEVPRVTSSRVPVAESQPALLPEFLWLLESLL